MFRCRARYRDWTVSNRVQAAYSIRSFQSGAGPIDGGLSGYRRSPPARRLLSPACCAADGPAWYGKYRRTYRPDPLCLLHRAGEPLSAVRSPRTKFDAQGPAIETHLPFGSSAAGIELCHARPDRGDDR